MALLTPEGAREPRALLFDLDDTIIDYSGSYERSWHGAAQLACDAVEGLARGQFVAAIQQSRDAFWQDPVRAERGRRDLRAASTEVVSGAFTTLAIDAPPGLARAIAEDYRERRETDIALFPDAVTVLERLHGAGFRLGLVTNGSASDQRRKVERFELEPYFEHIQIEGELGIGKPHAAAYEHALGALSEPPEATWFIGDNIEWDVTAPQRHGMFGVWVSPDRALWADAPGEPDHTIESIAELVDLT
jgi:putative hydrolase of the HAD superfamily